MTEMKEFSGIRGELTYSDKVIEKMIGLALESVDGLLAVSGGFFANLKDKIVNSDEPTTGVHVEVGKKQVAVDLAIIAEYKKHLPTIYKEMKAIIESEVKAMTDLEVVEVNVEVVDIKTREQYEAESVSLQDKVADAASSAAGFTSAQVDKASKGVENLASRNEPRVI
ncbi:TPA: Asp23/Gls24 family envelope stress response protein [Streptococcus suis]|uniref:Stress response regulator gls24 homolog n=2 Tax=Streptococcus TaxID=1301 RepID=A0A6L8MZW3_STRSU|nr:Asp23/Gls24 family envelope stress response protein [Streptococcus parasuis]MYN70592.1 Asp23/Gls24 family envelope stress response protein [Streptococcus suis]BCP60140.1 transcriptional regulator [Streptococcus parasuis]BCP64429.1 transcriptional regulator [Streptococcus parasuis]